MCVCVCVCVCVWVGGCGRECVRGVGVSVKWVWVHGCQYHYVCVYNICGV